MFINHRLRQQKTDNKTVPVAEISSDEDSMHDELMSTDIPTYTASPIAPIEATPPIKSDDDSSIDLWYSQRV